MTVSPDHARQFDATIPTMSLSGPSNSGNLTLVNLSINGSNGANSSADGAWHQHSQAKLDLIELTSAAVYYYTWDRIPERLHLKVGWVYAISSICTLVIINGILSFMLTPGATWLAAAGSGHESTYFWNAFFNPTYWPSLCLRVLVCLSLAGVWALVSFSRLDEVVYGKARTEMVRWSASWLAPSDHGLLFRHS